METVNIREARRRLSDLIDAAERGESVLITRHGREVARIGPAQPSEAGPLPDLSDFRASIDNQGQGLSKTVAEGRKQARY